MEHSTDVIPGGLGLEQWGLVLTAVFTFAIAYFTYVLSRLTESLRAIEQHRELAVFLVVQEKWERNGPQVWATFDVINSGGHDSSIREVAALFRTRDPSGSVVERRVSVDVYKASLGLGEGNLMIRSGERVTFLTEKIVQGVFESVELSVIPVMAEVSREHRHP